MGVDLELDASGRMDQSPNSVLPTFFDFPDAEKRSTKPPLTRRDEILRVKEGFTEISFRRYRSLSCKDNPSRGFGMGNRIQPQRGSIYQNSKEINEMRKMGNIEGRNKIELSRSSDASFSFRIVDSLRVSDKINQPRSSQLKQEISKLNPSQAEKGSVGLNPSDGFIDICLNSDIKERNPAEDLSEDLNSRFDDAVGPLNDGPDHVKGGIFLRFQKSHTIKVGMPNSLSSETDQSTGATSRVRFSPIKRMFDPFVKSKSLRSPLSYVAEGIDISGKENTKCNETFGKQLSNGLRRTAQFSATQVHDSDHQYQAAIKSSPVHLHGHLKLENRHGMPVFEFSLDCPDDAYAAKSWRKDNGSNWVYTFHSIGTRKKSNASSRGLNDGGKDSLIIGQMHVSHEIRSEVRDGLESEKSMVTEFVLYDIAHARRSVSNRENLNHSPDTIISSKGSKQDLDLEGSNDGPDAVKHNSQLKGCFESQQFDFLVESNPWMASVCSTDLEIAAIVIQVPIEKRESLKYKRGNKVTEKRSLLNLSYIEECKKELHGSKSLEKLKVVIPSGNHSLPSAEKCFPSPLLQRWRLGGGCDCGGWDMACPLIVFGNPSMQCGEDQPLVDSHCPLELFVQGAKDGTPALSITVLKEGQYAVDFHAQLSALQAFSICVAIVHGAQTSVAASCNERSVHSPHCDSLKMLIEDEVKDLVEAVIEEEDKKKRTTTKTTKPLQSSYMPNPPFSPISRV